MSEMVKGKDVGLEERMARLERANKRLTFISLVAVASMVLACGPGGEAKPREAMVEVLTTSKLKLMDPKGNLRATLSADDKGGLLVLNDGKGVPRVSLRASEEKRGIELFGDLPAGASGEPPVQAALTANGKRASVDVHDAKGQVRGSLEFSEPDAGLTIRDEAGNVTYSSPDKQGSP